jgi:hypothetical protein
MVIVHSLGPAEIARLLSRHAASDRGLARDAGAQPPSAFHQQSQLASFVMPPQGRTKWTRP